MTVGFSGEVAGHDAWLRRGYRPELMDALQEVFGLSTGDTVLDLGCGTGRLAVPLAARVRAVLGMDSGPDRLRLAREAADAAGVTNATWVLGTATDVPALGALLGRGALGMAAVGRTPHGTDHERLFHELRSLLRPGGGIAVIVGGAPPGQQDSAWSDALRGFLESRFGAVSAAVRGTDADGRDAADARVLRAAGYDGVREIDHHYRDELTFEQLADGVWSALPPGLLPAADRPLVAAQLREALPAGPYAEEVRVRALVGRTVG